MVSSFAFAIFRPSKDRRCQSKCFLLDLNFRIECWTKTDVVRCEDKSWKENSLKMCRAEVRSTWDAYLYNTVCILYTCFLLQNERLLLHYSQETKFFFSWCVLKRHWRKIWKCRRGSVLQIMKSLLCMYVWRKSLELSIKLQRAYGAAAFNRKYYGSRRALWEIRQLSKLSKRKNSNPIWNSLCEDLIGLFCFSRLLLCLGGKQQCC